ncbi:MAG: hypothetical protein ACPH58_09405, partial [Porticoccaceae bacterium]
MVFGCAFSALRFLRGSLDARATGGFATAVSGVLESAACGAGIVGRSVLTSTLATGLGRWRGSLLARGPSAGLSAAAGFAFGLALALAFGLAFALAFGLSSAAGA